jgi:phenylalanyl-tRNA synthetase beta chain
MLAPLSWLKKYVDIKLPLKDLMWRMTEVGLTTEKSEKVGDDYILDVEVTPNRPDWMSIIGIAREISAIENTRITLPEIPEPPAPKAQLSIKIHNNFELCPRYTAVTIKNVTQKPSPAWMQEYLTKVGLRPINNLVDITNFVMFETGNPIHVFDYDKLVKGEMTIMKSAGGEKFISVDEKAYSLPDNAIIFKSGDTVVDLCGIKGGANSGVTESTKNILILVAVYNGKLIRRTSQRLGLWSEASRIFERGANNGGTLDTLKRTVDLVLEFAGGTVASKIVDIKKEDFNPWKLTLRLSRLEYVLGIKIPDREVLNILDRLNLSPVLENTAIECTIPTYRGDLKIEEDLIEEVARLYGYNNFPKTLPIGEVPVQIIPYYKDYAADLKLKNLLTGGGFSEVQTYSLVSEKDLELAGISTEDVLRVDNPVSREFEYLRPTLKPNLIKAFNQNKPFYAEVNLFETGKVYLGKNVKEAKEEYHVAGITNKKNYFEVKGLLERIFSAFQVEGKPADYIEQLPDGVYFSFPYTLLSERQNAYKTFIPLPKYPSLVEDMAFVIPDDIRLGDVIAQIRKQSNLIKDVQLLDKYQDTRTFRIVYQSFDKNLTADDVSPARTKITHALKEKGIRLK